MTNWRERRLGAHLRRSHKREQAGAEEAAKPIIFVLREKARDHANKALEALADLMQGASSEHVRVAAANAILDRALGKPLPGTKAAEEEADADEDEPLEVRWLGEN